MSLLPSVIHFAPHRLYQYSIAAGFKRKISFNSIGLVSCENPVNLAVFFYDDGVEVMVSCELIRAEQVHRF